LDPGAPPVRSKATSDRRRLKPISTKRCTLAWCGYVRLAAPRETPDTERGDFIEGGKPCSFLKKIHETSK